MLRTIVAQAQIIVSLKKLPADRRTDTECQWWQGDGEQPPQAAGVESGHHGGNGTSGMINAPDTLRHSRKSWLIT